MINISFALAFLAVSLVSQQPPVRVLSEPLARSANGYTNVTGVRELRDGRLIIVDADEQTVYVLAPDLASHQRIGRIGSGPGEYKLPSRILPLPEDTTGILDESRLLIVTPDAQLGASRLLPNASPALETPWAASSPPQAADGRARIYALASPVAPGSDGTWRLADSAAVLRWRTEQDVDTAAFVPANIRDAQLIGRMVVTPPRGPYAAAPVWAVAPDGLVAVVYPEPYHVAFYRSGRRIAVGPRIAYRRIEMSDAQKEHWRVDQKRPRPLTIRQREEEQSAIIKLSPPYREPESWPRHLPPFLTDAATFAPDGRLWVHRTHAPGEHSSWDVFDQTGRVIEIVSGPPNSRIAAFGRNSLYVIRRDAFDVEYLERHAVR